MSKGLTNRRTLSHLLTRIEEDQKKCVTEYSGGHLNERNLYKYSSLVDDHKWPSSKFTSTVPLISSEIETTASIAKHAEAKEALQNFCIGATGIVSGSNKTLMTKGTKLPVQVDRETSVSSQGSYSRHDDGILVESIDTSKTVTMAGSFPRPGQLLLDDQLSRGDENVSFGHLKHTNPTSLKHRFVSSHLHAVTRKDQFLKMKAFEENILLKSSLAERNIMSGVKTVEHLERKLQQELQKLQHHGYGPNFHRLQVYSNTFENLIDESPTFRYILGTIKKEYDDYISSLLDQQPSRHRLLYEQVEQLSSHGTSNPQVLKGEETRLLELEESARTLLLQNSGYRQQLQIEKVLSDSVTDQETESTKINTVNTELDLELADRIEETHATILEKLDQLKELRKTLRKEFVPSTVVTHLEQCIKETEVESQRYQSQKEYFERSCFEMEKELRDAIESADTTEKDSKRIWKKVNASKKEYGSDSEEGDDEDKWGWYIS